MQQVGFHKVPRRYLFREGEGRGKESRQKGVLHSLAWRWKQSHKEPDVPCPNPGHLCLRATSLR